MPTYRAWVEERPAVIGPGGLSEGFTIDLPSYWRAKTVAMLKDPSTYAAQGILIATTWVVTKITDFIKERVCGVIKKIVRRILHKEAGVDYDLAEEVAEEASEVIWKFVLGGFKATLLKIADILVERIIDRIFEGRIARLLTFHRLKRIKAAFFEDRQRWLKKFYKMPAVEEVSRLKKAVTTLIKWNYKIPVGSLSPVKEIVEFVNMSFIFELALQIVIENLIDTVEFLTWPTKAVGRKLSIGLMGGPNVLDTLASYFGFKFTRRHFAVYAQGLRPGVRNPAGTRIRPARTKFRVFASKFRVKDLVKTPRWVIAVEKPYYRHAARLGFLARFFLKDMQTWSFSASDIARRLLPKKLAVIVYRGKGLVKVMTAVPLAGAPLAEAIARELNPADDFSADSLQGYYYTAVGVYAPYLVGPYPYFTLLLGTAALVKLNRQDYHYDAIIHHSLGDVGNHDDTVFVWEAPS